MPLGCLAAAWLCLAAAHPFYVTLCQIDHNPETRGLEITFRFFTDDLEQALDADAGTRLFLGTPRELDRTDTALFDYLNARVQVDLDGTRATLRFVGKEVEPDLTWCYVDVVDVDAPSHVEVTNRILLERFEAQTNIVHVTVGGTQKSLLLREGAVSGSLTF